VGGPGENELEHQTVAQLGKRQLLLSAARQFIDAPRRRVSIAERFSHFPHRPRQRGCQSQSESLQPERPQLSFDRTASRSHGSTALRASSGQRTPRGIHTLRRWRWHGL
jgi:hypothetical protein